ncbi:hypothetical protein D3C72_1632490 [compost metagenome]
MQVVARVIGGQQAQRVRGVARQRVEVEHGIKAAAGAYPRIQLLAQRIFFWLVIVAQRCTGQGAFEWRQGGSDHAHAAAARLGDQLGVAVC